MHYLLDTHAFLWLAADDPRLDANVRALFTDASNEIFLSAASVWEMAIQASLGKLTVATPLARSLARLVAGGVERGIQLLHVSCDHAYQVEKLPFHHRDPFDRLLVAQASHGGMQLVSRDPKLDAYPAIRVWDRVYVKSPA
jgi:PIN domain nuclease of toxin-antitoxin system